MTVWHHKHNILLITICFYHRGVPLQTRDLSSSRCKNSLEMCRERLRWVSSYILALIAKEHTVKHLNNIFTDVQLDAREQNWSPRLKMFAAALQWWKMWPSVMHMADPLAERPQSLSMPCRGAGERIQLCFLLTFSFPHVPEQQGRGRLWESENKSPSQEVSPPCPSLVNERNPLEPVLARRAPSCPQQLSACG